VADVANIRFRHKRIRHHQLAVANPRVEAPIWVSRSSFAGSRYCGDRWRTTGRLMSFVRAPLRDIIGSGPRTTLARSGSDSEASWLVRSISIVSYGQGDRLTAVTRPRRRMSWSRRMMSRLFSRVTYSRRGPGVRRCIRA
jgi:hypothetical protein